MAVEAEECAVEALLDDAAAEIGLAAQGVCLAVGACVLQHHGPVAVVGIGQCEGSGGEGVKEHLLCGDVCLEGLVIVEVVAGKVGEYASPECQSGYAVLVCGMRAHLHRGIAASGFDHLCEQTVDGDGVGCGVVGGIGCGVDIVADRREESGLISHQACHLVDEGRCRGLAVGAGDAHEAQLARGVVIPLRRQQSKCLGTR